MGKHHSADEKLVSRNVRKASTKSRVQTSAEYSAPQVPKPGTNSKNQYR